MKTYEEAQNDSIYWEVPQITLETINNFVTKGWDPGGFVSAVLSNNLSQSFDHADRANAQAMRAIVVYVYNEIPRDCWGDEQKVTGWIEKCRDPHVKREQRFFI